ncbi:uncharacterized protein [Clytia hemisphaerica]|uniref:Cnidarian restricted protein n=1 Tax=Clytia hemisphaerica TaxID=252671 RepID=A0A7M5UTW3_9CNID|eukprot:TCONS_00065553-protein
MEFLIWFLTNITLVYSQWFSGEEKLQATTNTDKEDVSKPFQATSPIQCILKCQRRSREGYFVENKEQCFCLKSEDQKILSDEKVNGIFYKPVTVEKPIDSCKAERKRCLDCQSDFYELDIGEDEKKNVFCNFEKDEGNGGVGDGSCMAIKEHCIGCSSGLYYFEILGIATEVFCEMTEDGGGWMAIVNITFDDNSLLANAIAVLEKPSLLNQLNNIQSGRFLLASDELKKLFTNGGYTELRVKCFKPYHGRTLHAAITGTKSLTYLRGKGVVRGDGGHCQGSHCGLCGEVRFLADDTSIMGQRNCSQLGMGMEITTSLYDHAFFVWGERHWSFLNKHEDGFVRFECDDFSADFNGEWMVYVR